MRTVFVDTAYWIAQSDTRDQWHYQALEVEQKLTNIRLITSELVLIEFLNYFCKLGRKTRERITLSTQEILMSSNIQVIWQTPELFESGLSLYGARLDKGYSLTDCVSMVIMRQIGIQEVLSNVQRS